MRKVRNFIRAKNYDATVLVSGHSSGDALTEAFAFEIINDTRESRWSELNVNLVTWNGVGPPISLFIATVNLHQTRRPFSESMSCILAQKAALSRNTDAV